jgi:septal ring factor EnvC (AmiA/AmiB activator)
MAVVALVTLFALSGLGGVDAATRLREQASLEASSNVEYSANPIRKVVMMLQNMQTKIAEESKKKEEMYDKYMCYCKTSDGTLGTSISAAETKIPQVDSSIKEAKASKTQLEGDVKNAQASRAEAKDTVAKSTAIRNKEASAYAKTKSDLDTNIAALGKAIPAIEKGMAGAFLQTKAASVLRDISLSANMNPADRDLLSSFLSEGSSYVPRSGEIVGILKELKDEMERDLADATSVENSAIASYKGLMASKNKEIDALTKEIETKTTRIGELGVQIAQMENDLEDTQEGLAEDQKFLADLDGNCQTKQAEWATYKKIEADELVALAETIKVLNDDDALDLFKKTLPSASSSFVQVQVGKAAMWKHALVALKGHGKDPRVDLIEMAMRGGKMGFDKIIKMIDELVKNLEGEQALDEDKKSYCLDELDKSEDKKKGLDADISDLNKAIEDNEEQLANLANQIKTLTQGIKDLDKQVAEATATRKEEHDSFVATLADNTNAKDLLAFAKNRLNKFYNPKLYKPAPKRALSEEDAIVVNMGGTLAPTAAPGGIAGTGIGFNQVAPPPPPAANLAYKTSGEESNGVIGMIDLLIADLDKDIQEATVDEKEAQKEYEKFMSDAAEKRALDSKATTDAQSAKAETESDMQSNKESKKSKSINSMETAKYLGGLHAECDWLLKYYDARKSARVGEIESLGKAKAVLNGADYSLVQTGSLGARLRGSQ